MKASRMSEPPISTQPRWRKTRWLLRQAEHGLALIGVGMLLYFACFDLSRITSDSMAPTLRGHDWKSGDWVLTEKLSYWLRGPRRWEVITFRMADGVQVMKRVVGLPGENVQMSKDGQIIIDGQAIDFPERLAFLHYFPYGNIVSNKTAACKDGYYVLGDDSRDSDDSRFNGPVLPDQLIGRSWLIVAPAEHRRFVR
jgi:signal peptidase I